MTLVERVCQLEETEPDKRNSVSNYLPYRKGAKRFDYRALSGAVLSALTHKRVPKKFSVDGFKEDCLSRLRDVITDESAVVDIERMYWGKDALEKTSPEFLLLRTESEDNASTKHLSKIVESFLSERSPIAFSSATNFIEKSFLEILSKSLRTYRPKSDETPFLPFVASLFERDVGFLTKHPDYLLEQLAACIELYTFIYCSQLGLSLSNWRGGEEPESRPLYFILDTEKASSERRKVREFGYQHLERTMANVFPILTMLDYLNRDKECTKEPIWKFARELQSCSTEQSAAAIRALKKFGEEFQKAREFPEVQPLPNDVNEAFAQLFRVAVQQFDKKRFPGRHRVLNQYLEVFQQNVASDFLSVRGRSGRTLVINQDYILLLANLAVGERKHLRMHQLLQEFEARGFYFDKQSQQALIKFFERVGNVDRMSDSGDAVYVRSTV